MPGGWTRSHSSGFPTATRRRILRRDPWCTCNGCPDHPGPCVNPSTIADHITPRAEGGSDAEANGQGLCSSCHRHKTQAEATRGRQRKSRRRPTEDHPGLIAKA